MRTIVWLVRTLEEKKDDNIWHEDCTEMESF